MNRSILWAAGGLAAVFAIAHSARAASDPVMGDWLTVGGSARVRVAACAANPALACGTLVWLKEGSDKTGAPVHDANNPDQALRARPLVGVLLVSNFRRDTPGHWVDGKIYDPDSGKTYNSKMTLNPDGSLKVEGCILMICQARTWTRAPGT